MSLVLQEDLLVERYVERQVLGEGDTDPSSALLHPVSSLDVGRRSYSQKLEQHTHCPRLVTSMMIPLRV